MKRKHKVPWVIIAMLSVILVITIFQSFQISSLYSAIRSIEYKFSTIKSSTTSSGNALQQILEEITPKGTPDYGKNAGISYDDVENSLRTLTGYATLSLSKEEQERYNTIANIEGTACKYCCGATKLAQNCGCSHNIALQGLTKWLIKNTEYSNDEILQEIRKWQILFFPRPTLQEELEKRNINPESVGLPAMRGGC